MKTQLKLKFYPQNQCLREKCVDVQKIGMNDYFRQLLDNMVLLMAKSRGCGLAAPQVGINKRFFVMAYNGIVRKVINPEILNQNTVWKSTAEGCLSLPNRQIKVPRPTDITVEYFDENWDLQTVRLRDMEARIYLHELDHLNGKLIIDYK